MKDATKNMSLSDINRRILIVDDNAAIHDDIRNVLRPRKPHSLANMEAELFGGAIGAPPTAEAHNDFDIDSAYQGDEALAMVEQAVLAERPYSVALVDVRMPPGWDGIETIERLRTVDPHLQVVICSAFSDYSWTSIHERLRATDWLIILRKPFEPAEIQQLANAMCEKWNLTLRASLNTEQLRDLVQRQAQQVLAANAELERRNTMLTEVNERLSREVSARHQADERIRHIAYHDALTNLPNRAYLMERLQVCVDRSKRRRDYRYALLFIDLDNFKLVNDSLGHRAGDLLLAQMASIMMNAIRTMHCSIRSTCDTVARIGGDEFIVLLDDIHDSQNVYAVAERIRHSVSVPLCVGQRSIVPGISIGAAISHCEYDDVVDILRDADTALYHAKANGKGRTALFDQTMRSEVLERADVENDLQLAITKREFEVYYQPIVSLETGELRSLEALVRWQHPTRGLLPPDCFIPIAEHTGMIAAIGNQVLEQVAEQLSQWRTLYRSAARLSVSVNLSAGQLVDDAILHQIDRCLTTFGLGTDALKVELTESTAMQNLEVSQAIFSGLQSRGIDVYLDDFGTGYSSLSMLHTFPFAAIKLDKSFMADLETEIESETTVRAIIMIAQSRNIPLIAEGIETAEQLAALRRLDCQLGQGYFFSRPLPRTEIERVIERAACFSFTQDTSTPEVASRNELVVAP